MRRASGAALVLGCWWLAAAPAQEREPQPEEREPERGRGREQEPLPELDFLEYLGTWAEEDDEWLAIETWEKDNADEADEDPEGSERERDQDDESE